MYELLLLVENPAYIYIYIYIYICTSSTSRKLSISLKLMLLSVENPANLLPIPPVQNSGLLQIRTPSMF